MKKLLLLIILISTIDLIGQDIFPPNESIINMLIDQVSNQTDNGIYKNVFAVSNSSSWEYCAFYSGDIVPEKSSFHIVEDIFQDPSISILKSRVYKFPEKHYLNWSVSKQSHSKEGLFIIESSTDSINFKPIGFKRHFGTSIQVGVSWQNEISEDKNSKNFYRVLLMYVDGAYNYSSIF
jgi:hypothetical protein